MMQMELLDRLASRIGLQPAILLLKVRAWTRTNEKKGQQLKDGRYWTYNSITAWHELIPYLTEKQIRTAMKYLRDNGYLLSEKARKHQWNQTLHYALSDFAFEVFRQIEGNRESASDNVAHSSDESAFQGNPFCPDRELDLPSRSNDINALPNPLPDNEIIPSPSIFEPKACSEDVPWDSFVKRLETWHVSEAEMQAFLWRTGRPAIWAYQWLGIMAEDIRSGHVSEYRSPIGALMKRHKENWPFPRVVRLGDLLEKKELQRAVEHTRSKMLAEYESAEPDPASMFIKIHKKHAVPT